MRLFLHALGASAGGGLTYLWNVLPQLVSHPELRVSLLVGKSIRTELGTLPDHIELIEHPAGYSGTLARFLWEQREVPRLIRKTESEVLLCTGNFAIWGSPVPQILLSRNSLYTSSDFRRDLWRRREYRLWLETRLRAMLARKSVQRAESTVAPSEAFAREMKRWAGREVIALHHGFDRDQFFRDSSPLPASIQEQLLPREGVVRLLHVSHYNYYRDFETLLRATAVLKQRGLNVKLVLTCNLSEENHGGYRSGQARGLLRDLEIAGEVIQLGTVPYHSLHHLYHSCDLYLTAAYTETFAHPLVEAMACGVPIVASDLGVHREITNGAALFFPPFSPVELAQRVSQLVKSPSLRSELRARGLEQSAKFSWKAHVERLLELAKTLARPAGM